MPGTLASSARSYLAYKLEGTYPTNFGVLQAGNGTLLARTKDDLNADFNYVESKTIRSDRQVAGVTQVDTTIQGSFDWEQVWKEYDPFVQAAVQNDYTVYGTNGVSGAMALTPAVNSFTAAVAPTGNDAYSNLHLGQWFVVRPPAGASAAVKAYFASRPFRVSLITAPTTTVITLDASTPVDTAITGTSSITGCNISTSHVRNGTTVKSYSMEVGHLDIGQYRQYLGMITAKMMVKIDPGSIVTGTFEFMGKSADIKQATGMGTPSASQSGTPANGTKGIFDIIENGTSLSASTYLKNAEFTIDNTLRDQKAVGVFGNAGVGVGTLRVTGKLQVYFTDALMYSKVLNATNSSLAIPVLDKDGRGYVYYFPFITYTAMKADTGAMDSDSMLNIDFTATLDQGSNPYFGGYTVVIYRV